MIPKTRGFGPQIPGPGEAGNKMAHFLGLFLLHFRHEFTRALLPGGCAS